MMKQSTAYTAPVRVGLGFLRATQFDAGEWLDRQNTAVEPVLFPGIATRT